MPTSRFSRTYGIQIDYPEPGSPSRCGPVAASAALADLHRRFRLRVISCLHWRTRQDWTIEPRRLADTLLFIPLHGRAEIALGNVWRPCGPGSVAILPEPIPHAARLARGQTHWEVFAIHLVADDAWGSHFAAAFTDHVLPLHDHLGWGRRLARLSALFNQDRDLGESHGADLLRLLLSELLLDGAHAHAPGRSGDPRIAAALQTIAADPGHANVDQLARAAALSPARFRQLFHHCTGRAPKQTIAEQQAERASRLLRESRLSVREVATECGFSSDHHFHRRFKQRFGMTPSQWRQHRHHGP